MEANGFVGGIWCLWDKVFGEVKVVNLGSQFVHLSVKRGDYLSFIIACYARPQASLHIKLWQEIRRISMMMQNAWCVVGDFNSLLYDHERHGRTKLSSLVSGAFKAYVQECFLVDLGFQGPSYTWKCGSLRERLDKVLCSESWQVTFLETLVTHRPFFK